VGADISETTASLEDVYLLDVMERTSENCGVQIAEFIADGINGIRQNRVNERKLLRYDQLPLVIQFFSLVLIEFLDRLIENLIDPGFPFGCRFLLARVPQMELPG
jgi:hypothetical protein